MSDTPTTIYVRKNDKVYADYGLEFTANTTEISYTLTSHHTAEIAKRDRAIEEMKRLIKEKADINESMYRKEENDFHAQRLIHQEHGLRQALKIIDKQAQAILNGDK